VNAILNRNSAKGEDHNLHAYLKLFHAFDQERKRTIERLGHGASSSHTSLRILNAAKKQTYLFLLQWLYHASPETLAKFWKLLHGFPTTVRTGLQMENYTLPETFAATLELACTSRDSHSDGFRALLTNTERRRMFFKQAFQLHRKMPRQQISVYFRDPHLEDEKRMSPQYASCTASLGVSICHETYESFALAMDGSLVGDNNFTMNG